MEAKKLVSSGEWLKLKDMTWFNILEMTAQKYPDNEAIVFQNKRVSYKEYLERVYETARGLYSIGVRRGDHVALWMTNRLEWLFARFSINKLGAVMVPLNTRFKAEEIRYVLRDCDARVLIMEDKFLGKIDAMRMLEELCPELHNLKAETYAVTSEFPLLRAVISLSEHSYNGCFSWEQVINKGQNVPMSDIESEVYSQDVAHLIYTSGTTGFPKGALTLYSNSVSMGALFAEFYQILKPGERILIMTPLFGNIGLSRYGAALISGATVVLMERFDPEDALRTIQQEKINYVAFVPTMLADVLGHPNFGQYDLSSLKSIGVGGAKVSAELILEAKNKLGVQMGQGYGLVEASGLSTVVPPGDTVEHLTQTVGLALPHCEVAILDPLSGEPLPPGKEGEICTRETYPGSQFMKGYYKRPDLTAETIKGGWLHSGDLGVVDEEGYLRITGRLKEMFTVGGFNVSPGEVEQFLTKYPKIKNVAVVGVPDQRLGEVGAAFIELKPGETSSTEEIIGLCKNNLANIKVPRYVFFVNAFPLNPQGKVQKFKLLEQAVKELGI